MLIGQRKEHVVDAVLLHEVGSALLGETCEEWDTMDMMVRYIVCHWYHLHSGIVTGNKQYNFSSYPFNNFFTIHVIMVVFCMKIG